MMQVVCCQLAVRLETGTLGLTTERTSDGAWVESSVSSACLVRCVALELRGEVLAFLFIMYKPDPEPDLAAADTGGAPTGQEMGTTIRRK